MKRLLILGISGLAIMVSASAATGAATLTKAQAFKSARVCLLNHGATSVVRRGDGGGFSFFRAQGSTFWTYKTFLGQVESVTVYFAGRPGLSSAKKRMVRTCLTKGI
jgi:hypothetical protein